MKILNGMKAEHAFDNFRPTRVYDGGPIAAISDAVGAWTDASGLDKPKIQSIIDRRVRAARDAGISWGVISLALGVSSSEARLRYEPVSSAPALPGLEVVRPAVKSQAPGGWAAFKAAIFRRFANQILR